MSTLSLSLLGPFQASLRGEALTQFRTNKVKALLVYLAVEAIDRPGRLHFRESLMELLWPGMPLKSAQVNLRQTLYQLRKAIPELLMANGESLPFLSADHHTLAIHPDCVYELDVATFMQLLRDKPGLAQLEQAAGLYRGDFLSDFYLPDSADFEAWAANRRADLRRQALSALETLTSANIRSRNFEQAEAFARRLLKIDELSENANGQLIEVLARLGRRSMALSHYESFRHSIATELGMEPSEEMAALVERIRNGKIDSTKEDERIGGWMGTAPIPSPISPVPPRAFVGREERLRQLHEHLDVAMTGQGRVVFVTGEAGAGKTALMEAFAHRSQQAYPGLVAVRGSCNAFTGAGDPLLPFREVMRALSQDLESYWTEGADTRERLFEQFTHKLLAISKHNPLLIMLDDLQWSDLASLNLLFHLARSLAQRPVLVVGAYRPSEVTLGRPQTGEPASQQHPLLPVVNELRREFGDIQIDLDRFAPVEGRAFVDAYLDHVFKPNRLDEDFRVRLFWRTKGNPLFTVELLRDMQARRDLVHDREGCWMAAPALNWETLPARVEAVIQQRLGRLETALRDLLLAACVEGETFTAQVTAHVQNLDPRTALRLLSRELDKRHGLVRPAGEVQLDGRTLSRYRFAHVLFQEYLYNQLGPAERNLLHGETAGAIEDLFQGETGAFSVQLARHYAEAGEGKQAIPYLLQAGDHARTLYAHEEASEHYRQAIELLKDLRDHAGAAQALMKLGMAYHNAFDFERARQVYQEGFALWERAGRQPVTGLPPAPHPLRVAWLEPSSFDPTMGGYSMSAPLVTQLFSGLVALSPELEVVPDVAQRWEVLDEGRRYVFHLREDVYWSDGIPLTAADFEYTFKRALDPAIQAPVAGLLLHSVRGALAFQEGHVSDPAQVGITAQGERTLVIELDEPTSYFLQNLSYYVLLPVPRHVVEIHGPAWADTEHIVTNGPFRLVEWQPGELMRLARNPRYHGRFSGNVEEVALTLNLDAQTQIERYAADELDFVYNWFFVSAELDALRQRYPGEYSQQPLFGTLFLILDATQPPLDDPRVRKALAMAIDKEQLASQIYQGYDLPATGGFTPPGMPGHAPHAGLPHDPLQAREILDGAGYPEGRGFPEVSCAAYPIRQPVAELLQDFWRQHLGVAVKVVLPDTHAILDWIREHHPDISLGGWLADYADPDNFLRVCVRLDLPEWRNPVYEALLERARQVTDQAERIRIYQQADSILMEEAVIIPLTYTQRHLMLKPWVRNFSIPAVKYPGFWKDVILEPHNE